MGAFERGLDDVAGEYRPLKTRLERVIADGVLHYPGEGNTLERWRALANVAACDLALVKLYEAHWDAAAILHEIEGGKLPPASIWGVWCAEPPNARVRAIRTGNVLEITGTKAWCSGASVVSHALISAWNEAGQPVLVAVDLGAPGVRRTARGWNAVGMSATQSVEVEFDHTPARQIGSSGAYTDRPGFWAGGAGIAACWFGCARAIGEFVARACNHGSPDDHRLAHLGAIDVALASSAAILRDAARSYDGLSNPPNKDGDTREVALRVRAVVERDCNEVMQRAGRALGATPFCQNEWFARAMADLPVFLRQSHAERELAALGSLVTKQDSQAWSL